MGRDDGRPPASNLLRQQYISGEISLEDYERLLAILTSVQPDHLPSTQPLRSVRVDSPKPHAMSYRTTKALSAVIAVTLLLTALAMFVFGYTPYYSPAIAQLGGVLVLLCAAVAGLRALWIKPRRGENQLKRARVVAHPTMTGVMIVTLTGVVTAIDTHNPFPFTPLMYPMTTLVLLVVIVALCAPALRRIPVLSAGRWMLGIE